MIYETPFPVEGTITPTDYGYSASLPCELEWLTETASGMDFLLAAVDRSARQYGEGIEVRVRFTYDRFTESCDGYEMLGPINGQQDGQ